MTQTSRRLAELGIVLPKPDAPVANYVPAVATTGVSPGALSLLWISGQLPLGPDGALDERHKGKLGSDSPIEPAREAAQRCAISILAQAQAALGDLDRVVRVVRLGGFFNVASSFDALPQAMNGASDLMADVFGERGHHARTTVGVAHLPLNALAEVEAVFEISA
jgi:enamine deaminase RidA (YjgF/YER057c/UK114 family)